MTSKTNNKNIEYSRSQEVAWNSVICSTIGAIYGMPTQQAGPMALRFGSLGALGKTMHIGVHHVRKVDDKWNRIIAYTATGGMYSVIDQNTSIFRSTRIPVYGVLNKAAEAGRLAAILGGICIAFESITTYLEK